MKRIKHTEEYIIRAIKRYEAGERVTELCREVGVAPATFYNWIARFSGMAISDAKKFKALEDENRRLKRVVADLLLDNETLKEELGQTYRTIRTRREDNSNGGQQNDS